MSVSRLRALLLLVEIVNETYDAERSYPGTQAEFGAGTNAEFGADEEDFHQDAYNNGEDAK
jgi:hypothetical protein